MIDECYGDEVATRGVVGLRGTDDRIVVRRDRLINKPQPAERGPLAREPPRDPLGDLEVGRIPEPADGRVVAGDRLSVAPVPAQGIALVEQRLGGSAS